MDKALNNGCRMIAASIVLFGATTMARADLKIVSEISTKGTPAMLKGAVPEKPTTMTTYYKGDKQRVEMDKTVTISDFASGKTYTLDIAKKTYTTFALADIDKMMADNPIMQMINVQTQTVVTPGTTTKSIAGKSAHPYSYDTSFKLSIEGADDQSGLAAMMPTINIKAEVWTSEDVKFSYGYQKMAQSKMARSLPPMMAKGMKEMTDKLAAIKGFPLSSVETVSFILPKNAPPQMTASMPKEPIITTTEVKTITEQDLDDALFAIPADYKEVKPAAPAVPAPAPDNN